MARLQLKRLQLWTPRLEPRQAYIAIQAIDSSCLDFCCLCFSCWPCRPGPHAPWRHSAARSITLQAPAPKFQHPPTQPLNLLTAHALHFQRFDWTIEKRPFRTTHAADEKTSLLRNLNGKPITSDIIQCHIPRVYGDWGTLTCFAPPLLMPGSD